MVVLHEGTQTSADFEERLRRQRMVEEGIKMWKEKQELARQKKIKEQAEAKEMLEKYWPFGQKSKPRGLRNLRLEGLFSNEDYKKAKRYVGVLDLGRPGCGAPMLNTSGQKVVRKREDPILRFQFVGNSKRYVDDELRYRTPRSQQEEYRKELDKLIEEKRRRQRMEKEADLEFERKQGWSNVETLKMLDRENENYQETIRKEYDKFKDMQVVKPNQIVMQDKVLRPRDCNILEKDRQGSGNGEIVSLLAKHRYEQQKKTLPMTDVTKNVAPEMVFKMKTEGHKYLQELSHQMDNKSKKFKELKEMEKENTIRHYSTWNTFWGRPGNGAPLPVIRKKPLDRLLHYPNMMTMTPISVA